jgi:hypothetical protein
MTLGISIFSLTLIPTIAFILIMVSIISLSTFLPYWFDSYRLGNEILSFTTIFTDELGSAILKTSQIFLIYIPLGIIGLWRWGIWIFKKLGSLYYVPINPGNHIEGYTMGIITPVYNEDPRVFRTALDSWQSNNPDELIAVIDQKDTHCIRVFREFAQDTLGKTHSYFKSWQKTSIGRWDLSIKMRHLGASRFRYNMGP